jgi:O-antigen/teichoic acid export membrane protein
LGKIKRLAGETVLYGLGSILPRFLNFLLVPLHTTVFAPAEYGVFTQLFAYVGIINIIFLFGMETAYFRFANQKDLNEQRVFNLTQTVTFSISLLCSVVFLLNAAGIASYLDIAAHKNIVIYLILIMFIDAVVAIPFARLRFQKKPLLFAIGKLINIGLLVGLNVYLLLYSGMAPDLSFIIIANLVANAFYLLFFFRSLSSWRPAVDKILSPRIFSYAYPVMITGLAGMANENLSRITLDNWLPKDFYRDPRAALGVFGGNYKYAVLMNLAIQAFRYAAEPFFFSQSTEKNSPQLFARINHYFVIVCCVLLLGVSINLDILKYFLGQSEYWEGLHIVPILLLAYLFLGIYYNYSVWFKLTDRTHFGTLITFIGLVVTVVGNYLLIPLYGYVGSSFAALLCYFSMMIVCYWFGQKYFPVPYTVGKDFLYIVATTVLIYVVYDADTFVSNQVIKTGFHILTIILFLVVTFFIERKHLRPSQA